MEQHSFDFVILSMLKIPLNNALTFKHQLYYLFGCFALL